MSYASRMYSLSAALLMSSALTAAPAAAPMTAYEAVLSGAASLALRGATARFGAAPSSGGPFVITLGAMSEHGAVVLTRWDGSRLRPGTYPITAARTRDGIQALVVTGTPGRPTGLFRARRGTATITSSTGGRMAGRFEMEAEGFLLSAPERAEQQLMVRGSFTALPSR